MDIEKTQEGPFSLSTQAGDITFIDAIDHQRRLFSGLRTDLFSQYLERDRKTSHQTARLVSMNGWGDSLRLITAGSSKPKLSKQVIQKLFRGEDNIERWGGYWLSAGGKGIAINPGCHFLQRFHEAELHIWDIDHVIVTDGNEASSLELERLWTLNKEINTLMKDWGLEPHIIQYWLHPKAFERYATKMRPHFRQEQGTLHRLDIFNDGHPYEQVEISPGLDLLYLAPSSLSSKSIAKEFLPPHGEDNSYAIRINSYNEAMQSSMLGERQDVPPSSSFGFFLHTPWSDSLLPLMSSLDVAVLGVGELSFEEIAKLSPHEHDLGYSGALSLTAALFASPSEKLPTILFAEYGMREGDFRIECIKQLMRDAAKKAQETREAVGTSSSPYTSLPRILPTEETMTFCVDTHSLLSAPGLDEPTHINDITVFRSQGPFSRLTYINKNGVL